MAKKYLEALKNNSTTLETLEKVNAFRFFMLNRLLNMTLRSTQSDVLRWLHSLFMFLKLCLLVSNGKDAVTNILQMIN